MGDIPHHIINLNDRALIKFLRITTPEHPILFYDER